MKQLNRFITFEQNPCRYRFLPSGDIFAFTNGDFLANQFCGNAKDGSVNNIYLRIYKEDRIIVHPLLGIKSQSRISCSDNRLRQEGVVDGITYQVTFCPCSSIWFWNISLSGHGETVDLVYGQDLGVSSAGSVQTNELYSSQYLGHIVFKQENGYVICSRQNLPSNSCTPYMQQGVINSRIVHYSTDGLQFFGLSCKEYQVPQALQQDLPDVNLQYEFAYTALQTEKMTLDSPVSLAFYGMLLQDHPEAVTKTEYQDEIAAAYASQKNYSDTFIPIAPVTLKDTFGKPFSSPSFTPEEIDALFPARHLEESENGALYSFFTPSHAHVVTKEKELLTERPHGTIIITPPDETRVKQTQISSTQYMYGIFNSHVVIGNTDLHKLLSTPRGFLNLLKNSGQRIYIRLNEAYRLLCLPGLFEMGMNYSRWFYKTPSDMIIVTAYAAAHSSDLILEVHSQNGQPYDFIVTNQLVMGTHEYTKDIAYEEIPDGLRFTLDSQVYPGLHYDILCPGQAFRASDDRIFFTDDTPFDETFLTLSLQKKADFRILIRGRMTAEGGVISDSGNAALSSEKAALSQTDTISCAYSFEHEKAEALAYYDDLVRHFHLESAEESERTSIVNETIWWYTHNAMIHFSMPHGLEQPGGAAWGTRDICQGPMEFFLTTQHYALARNVLLNIFAHQSLETKEWPQWFMFDRYPINAGECHGDVIFWPLKCVADYLDATGDYSILEELIAYDNAPDQKETLLSHIRCALSNIEETRLIGDTGLITYAGGDWDDTLQPANDELKQRLVSAWTVALAYQTFHGLARALKPAEKELSEKFDSLAALTQNAFETILIKDGTIAGFLECNEEYIYMLHPLDDKTGIHYRLLPMTRSIIAELASPAQALKNEQTILEHLKCPDGVRLMDHPAGYDGGTSRLFKRAEQAANVGREISLQYTHAHIRYIEAMAKLGNAGEAWDSLFVINPIQIRHSVKNARIRQSNMYFSSSDGAYTDRYDYAENFDLLRSGSIEVKGGWRLYSSGPGIYIRQLVGNVLGIRFVREGLVIDPILPQTLNNSTLTFECFGKIFHFRYHLNAGHALCAMDSGTAVPAEILQNPYRSGALLIRRKDLETCGNTIDIYTAGTE